MPPSPPPVLLRYSPLPAGVVDSTQDNGVASPPMGEVVVSGDATSRGGATSQEGATSHEEGLTLVFLVDVGLGGDHRIGDMGTDRTGALNVHTQAIHHVTACSAGVPGTIYIHIYNMTFDCVYFSYCKIVTCTQSI